MSVRNDRGQSRQVTINEWFAKFVEGLAYEKSEYHTFCEHVKGKSQREIAQYYGELV